MEEGPGKKRKQADKKRDKAFSRERTAHEEIEAARQRYRDLEEGIDHGIVWEADSQTLTFSFVSKRAETILGYPLERWFTEEGFWLNHTHPEDRPCVREALQKALSERKDQACNQRFIAANGKIVWFHTGVRAAQADRRDGKPLFRGLSVDITPLKEAHLELEARTLRLAAMARLGESALAGADLLEVMNEAVRLIQQTLKVDCASLFELLQDGDILLLRAGAGWKKGRVAQTGRAEETDSLAWYTLNSNRPVVVEELSKERRFKIPPMFLKRRVVSNITVPIHGRSRPFGVLGAHTVYKRTFNEDDIHFMQSVSNVLGAAIQRKRTEEALKQKTEQAEEANKTKSKFVSMVSHELRTPLNAILGFAELLRQKRVDEDAVKREEMLGRILANAKTLLEMINTLLDLGKVEAGQISVEEEEVCISTLLSDIVQERRGDAEAKGLTLTLENDPSSPRIRSDPRKLRQIFTNLISNAVKYTARGFVKVRSRYDPTARKLSVEVHDTGIGIEAKHLPRLFDPFYRADPDGRDGHGGTGLGLAIVKQFLDLLGGKIGVRSRPGKGSTFIVDLKGKPPIDGEPSHTNEP